MLEQHSTSCTIKLPPGHRAPSVTVGMPVYNGADHVGTALESLLAQTFSDFVVVVSDNASTDATGDIVQHFAQEDARIVYVRQPKNIGATANFKYVFHFCGSEYFMWAAADDTRSPDFLQRNVEYLDDHQDCVGSTLRTRFQAGRFDPVVMGDASLDQEDFADRVASFFGHWHANGRFYSLFRRRALAHWVNEDRDFPGADWTLVTYLASIGKLHRIDDGWTELGRNGASNATDIFAPYRKSPINWLLPFLDLTRDTQRLMRSASFGQRTRVTWRLGLLNLHAFLAQHRLMLRSEARL